MLDDGGTRGEVAVENGDGAFFFQGRGAGADDVLIGDFFGLVDDFGEGEAGDGAGGGVEERVEFAEERGEAAGVVEVLHVVIARGFEIDEYGNFAGEMVEVGEGEGDSGAGGDRGEVDEAIGGAADGL